MGKTARRKAGPKLSHNKPRAEVEARQRFVKERAEKHLKRVTRKMNDG